MTRTLKARNVTLELKKLTLRKDISFNEIRLIVAMERAVARLESIPLLSQHLIFKGGFVLLKTTDTHRFTRDIDALAHTISKEDVPPLIEAAMTNDLDDGFWYGDFQMEDLPDQGDYGGLRLDCAFQLGDPPEQVHKIKKLSRLHIDIGFGDHLQYKPVSQKMQSTLLSEKPISWLIYPLENIFAEKLQTLFQRGSANSRAKDIYDLVLVFPKCADKSKLASSIDLTFKIRKTKVPQSFHDTAEQLNLTLLRTSWSSVQLTTVEQSFEEIWKAFLIVCEGLDQLK